jgi:hypothetical protein
VNIKRLQTVEVIIESRLDTGANFLHFCQKYVDQHPLVSQRGFVSGSL